MENLMRINGLNNKLINLASEVLPQVRPIKKLLAEGADINHQTMEGYTPLMCAAMKGVDRVVEYLLKQGANPLLINTDNKIASELILPHSSIYFILKNYELLFATINDDLSMVTSLIETGAMIDFQGTCGYSALMIAVIHNQIEIVEYLLSQGSNLLLTCENNQNAFELATNRTIKNILENRHNLQLSTDNNRKPLTVSEKNHSNFFSNN